MSRKIFVIDTSVLLYDKNSIEAFSNNDIVLPMTVLEELDRFKEKPGVVGEAARHVNRFLDDLREVEYSEQWKIIPDLDIRIAFATESLSVLALLELGAKNALGHAQAEPRPRTAKKQK